MVQLWHYTVVHGPVLSALLWANEWRRPVCPNGPVNHVTPAIEPDKLPRSRPTSSLSEIGQDPQRVLDLSRREHIQQFWDSETDRARELGVFG